MVTLTLPAFMNSPVCVAMCVAHVAVDVYDGCAHHTPWMIQDLWT